MKGKVVAVNYPYFVNETLKEPVVQVQEIDNMVGIKVGVIDHFQKVD